MDFYLIINLKRKWSERKMIAWPISSTLAYGNMFTTRDTPHYIWKVNNLLSYGNEFNTRDTPQPSIGVPIKRCSENMLSNIQEIAYAEVWFQTTSIEITLWHRFSLTNLLYIFRTPFPKNTSGGLLLDKRRISFKVDFRDWLSQDACLLYFNRGNERNNR